MVDVNVCFCGRLFAQLSAQTHSVRRAMLPVRGNRPCFLSLAHTVPVAL